MEQSLPITLPHLRSIFPCLPAVANMVVDAGVATRTAKLQNYHARYHDQTDNIFLQMQRYPIPHNATDEPVQDLLYDRLDLYPLYQQLRAPGTDVIEDFESPYVHFFLQKMPFSMGFAHLFPSVFGTIFAHSMTNEGLRFMMLAVSSFLADNMAKRPPLRAYRYLQMGIPRIQEALTEGPIDDALTFSVFLAAYLHLVGGELASTRRHLQGLRILLQRYHLTTDHLRPDIPPEVMFVWRMAIRMDHQWAISDQNTIFPLVTNHELERRQWIQKLVDFSHPEKIDWALAQFALDDLLTRAIAINKRAIQLRANADSGVAEYAIRLETTKLLEEHQSWGERECIRKARQKLEAEQRLYAATIFNDPTDDVMLANFLDYPPLRVSDKLYGTALGQYYWVLMYITFITHPQPGPDPFERYQAAIEFCRTVAALGWSQVCCGPGTVLGLYLTGLTLGEPIYPKGNGICGKAANGRIQLDRG